MKNIMYKGMALALFLFLLLTAACVSYPTTLIVLPVHSPGETIIATPINSQGCGKPAPIRPGTNVLESDELRWADAPVLAVSSARLSLCLAVPTRLKLSWVRKQRFSAGTAERVYRPGARAKFHRSVSSGDARPWRAYRVGNRTALTATSERCSFREQSSRSFAGDVVH